MTNKTVKPPIMDRKRQGRYGARPNPVVRSNRDNQVRANQVTPRKKAAHKNVTATKDKPTEKLRANRRKSKYKLISRADFDQWSEVFALHSNQAIEAWKNLWHTPFNTLFTVLILGLAISLPTLFHASLNNFKLAVSSWNNSDTISIFLDKSMPSFEQDRLLSRVKNYVNVASVRYISPKEGLKEFKDKSGLSQLIDSLSYNPLPPVIEVTPKKEISEENLSILRNQLSRLSGVVEIDQNELWSKRVRAFLKFSSVTTFSIAVVLGLLMFVSVGNIVRLMVINRKEEIRIISLVGGTKGYTMLVFLYSGLWYGLLGGLFAGLFSFIAFSSVSDVFSVFSGLYGATFSPEFLSMSECLWLLLFSVLISVFGALFACYWQLKRLDKFLA